MLLESEMRSLRPCIIVDCTSIRRALGGETADDKNRSNDTAAAARLIGYGVMSFV